MSHHCPPIETLVAVRRLAADDPERLDAESCPRCRELLASHEEFLNDRSVPDGVDLGRASHRLTRAFEDMLAAQQRGEAEDESVAKPAAGARAADVRRPIRDHMRSRRFDWLFRPGSLAWGVIGVAMIVGGLYVGSSRGLFGRGEDVLRSDPGETREPGLMLREPALVAGGVELRWTPDPGADAYRVLLIGPDLEEIASLGPVADTMLVLGREALPEGLDAGTTLGWQVESQRGGFTLRSSSTGTLRLP